MYIIFSVGLTVFVGYIGYKEQDFPSTWMKGMRTLLIERFNRETKYLDDIEIFFVIFDIIFLIGAIWYAIQTSKEKSFEMEIRAKFESEKEWLWINLMIFFFTSITTFIELVSWRADNEYEIYLIADVIKLLCSFAIFILFVTKNDIRSLLTKKYEEMTGKSERLEFINNSV